MGRCYKGGYKYGRGKSKHRKINKTRKIFNQIDNDNNGVIDFNEFKSGLDKLTPHKSPTAKHKIFKQFDKDNNGVIDYQEFKRGIKSLNKKRLRKTRSRSRSRRSRTSSRRRS